MKTNYYILLILLLSFSFANAQSNEVSIETQSVSISEINKDVTVVLDSASNNIVNEELIIDTVKVKEAVARSSSDIKIYFNQLRNIENIKLLFPKINKAKTA